MSAFDPNEDIGRPFTDLCLELTPHPLECGGCRVQIRWFNNSATMSVAPAACWWCLRPAVRLQLATRPAVPERRVLLSVKRVVARLGLIQGLRECNSRWRTRCLFKFALCATPVNET